MRSRLDIRYRLAAHIAALVLFILVFVYVDPFVREKRAAAGRSSRSETVSQPTPQNENRGDETSTPSMPEAGAASVLPANMDDPSASPIPDMDLPPVSPPPEPTALQHPGTELSGGDQPAMPGAAAPTEMPPSTESAPDIPAIIGSKPLAPAAAPGESGEPAPEAPPGPMTATPDVPPVAETVPAAEPETPITPSAPAAPTAGESGEPAPEAPPGPMTATPDVPPVAETVPAAEPETPITPSAPAAPTAGESGEPASEASSEPMTATPDVSPVAEPIPAMEPEAPTTPSEEKNDEQTSTIPAIAAPPAEPAVQQPDESGAIGVDAMPLRDTGLEVLDDGVYWLSDPDGTENKLDSLSTDARILFLSPGKKAESPLAGNRRVFFLSAAPSDLGYEAAAEFLHLASRKKDGLLAVVAMPGATGAAFYKGAYLLAVRDMDIDSALAKIGPELNKAGTGRDDIVRRLARLDVATLKREFR